MSSSGYVFMIPGCPVSWRWKKQTIVATSPFDAEYIASCLAANEPVWQSRLIGDRSGHDKKKPIRVFTDNQGSIDSGKNESITQRNKHDVVQYHYVREVVALCKVEFVHCPTEDMVADQPTKTLTASCLISLSKLWVRGLEIVRSLPSRRSADSTVDPGTLGI